MTNAPSKIIRIMNLERETIQLREQLVVAKVANDELERKNKNLLASFDKQLLVAGKEMNRLKAIIRVNLLRLQPDVTHEQIDAIINATEEVKNAD